MTTSNVVELIVTIALLLFAFFAKDPDTRSLVLNVVVPYWFVQGAAKAKAKVQNRSESSGTTTDEPES